MAGKKALAVAFETDPIRFWRRHSTRRSSGGSAILAMHASVGIGSPVTPDQRTWDN